MRFPGPTHLVVGFQHRVEAERFLEEFRERLAKFGLELHPDKTRLIEFGRYAEATGRSEEKGSRRRSTFWVSPTSAGRPEWKLCGVAENGDKRLRAKLPQ